MHVSIEEMLLGLVYRGFGNCHEPTKTNYAFINNLVDPDFDVPDAHGHILNCIAHA